MKIGILGWDYGDDDPDSPGLLEMGRELGHDTSLFPLEEVTYVTSGSRVEVLVAGRPAESFDAIISRANILGDWRSLDYRGFHDRMERLTMLSKVPGVRLFDPADVWFDGHSKFRTAQILTAAGVPVPPIRSASTPAEVTAAFEQWGMTIVKPSFGIRGFDVERIEDPVADADLVAKLLEHYGTLVCQPYYPTQYGEYRVVVAGEAVPITMLKLPAVGRWRVKTLEGASFEAFDPPQELRDIAVRATRAMGQSLAGLDILPTADGYIVLEVNPVAGFFDIFGPGPRREVFRGIYEWVEKRAA
jgi:ribosomal protein S6--L-glutamate ligase